jgi:hypothetical protein
MSDFENIADLTATCILADCQRRIAPGSIYCPGHAAAERPQAGITQPDLETKARAAGEAFKDPPRTVGPDPDVNNWAIPPSPAASQPDVVTLAATGPSGELLAYLGGEYGAIKQATAQVLVEAMLTVLKRL